MTIAEVLEYLDGKMPLGNAESFDNVGLLVGSGDTEVTGICCCLDITNDIIGEAVEKGANLIVSHHPVIFGGIKNIPAWSPVYSLIQNGIAAIALHTNFDIAEDGVNDTLVELLEFQKNEVLEVTRGDMGFGAVCDIGIEHSPRSLAEYCKAKLYLDCVKYSRKTRSIYRIAVCCGGGVNDTVMRLAREKGCDAILSGDIKHNFWVEAESCGIALIDAGHFGTEKAASHRLAKIITAEFSQVPVFSAESEKSPAEYV